MNLVLPSSLILAVAATLLAGRAGEAGDAAGDDPGVVHVHGLAPDPDDPEAILAATHTGLFRIEDGQGARVGDAHHDLVGFTVTDDGAFLASGHPDLQSDLAVPDVPPCSASSGRTTGARRGNRSRSSGRRTSTPSPSSAGGLRR
jgi:hypothetical protein